MKTKRSYRMNKEFRMLQSEIDFYNELPSNLPETKLTKKQIDFVDAIYRKYITGNIDNWDWALSLFETELKEKWPSGPRMKRHEAKRIVLNNLVWLNTDKKVLTLSEASSFFLSTITCRASYQRLVSFLYR